MTTTLISAGHIASMPSLAERYRLVRNATVALCGPLETEDFVVSSMDDVSPTKWHLAHTSWFFETFVLAPHLPSYVTCNPRYAFLFNFVLCAGGRTSLSGTARTGDAANGGRSLRLPRLRRRSRVGAL